MQKELMEGMDLQEVTLKAFGMFLDNIEKNEKSTEPVKIRTRIHLENQSLMKFKIILCPEVRPGINMFWPLFSMFKEVSIADLVSVLNKIFPYRDNSYSLVTDADFDKLLFGGERDIEEKKYEEPSISFPEEI